MYRFRAHDEKQKQQGCRPSVRQMYMCKQNLLAPELLLLEGLVRLAQQLEVGPDEVHRQDEDEDG